MAKTNKAKFKKIKSARLKKIKKNKSTSKKKKLKTIKKTAQKIKKAVLETDIKKARLIGKGKERGFITYDEIIKEFPTIEDDVLLLEKMYEECAELGIDVLEGGRLLEENLISKKDLFKDESSYDSIQMYLKEIGQHSLISGAQEKELAKKIINGEEGARNILAKANLRL